MKSSSFAKQLSKSMDDLEGSVGAFLKYQNADSLHDLRTSIRRVESGFQLLPKSVRNGRRFQRYSSRVRDLFRATTPLRDIDTITSMLSEQEASNASVAEAISAKTEQERDNLLVRARLCVKEFERAKPPKVKNSWTQSDRIERRKSKLVRRLLKKMQEELPHVLDRPNELDKMHAFRKHCKDLRYALEYFEDENNEKEIELAKLSREWQSLLGEVRDIDLTEQFVRENTLSRDLKELLGRLQLQRDAAFESFLRSATTNELAALA